MKTILSVCVVVALAATALGDPQKKSFATKSKTRATHETAPPPVSKGGDVQGAIPRGFRGGNLLQMFNPKAPAKYGTWVQSTTFDPNVPGKWKGIKLFEIVF